MASLRKELAAQKSIAAEAHNYRTALNTTKDALSTAESHISELTTSHTELRNDCIALQAKLAAARTASTVVESTSTYGKTPGSAIKGKTPAIRTIMVGSAEAAVAAQVAQLKEDLYSDLTGLILRGVDRQEDSDVYDCIQTGRNGSKLCKTFSIFLILIEM